MTTFDTLTDRIKSVIRTKKIYLEDIPAEIKECDYEAEITIENSFGVEVNSGEIPFISFYVENLSASGSISFLNEDTKEEVMKLDISDYQVSCDYHSNFKFNNLSIAETKISYLTVNVNHKTIEVKWE